MTANTVQKIAVESGRNARRLFVSIEGVDGVGKTTVAKRLADRLSATYYKTPSGPFELIRQEVDRICDPITRFRFYLSAVSYASADISEKLQSSAIVCDRYIDSTLAYHEVLGVSTNEAARDGIIKPDLAVLLTVPSAERAKRLAGRQGSQVHDARFEQDETFLNRVEARFRKLGPIEVVATESVDSVVERIVLVLRDRAHHMKETV